MSWNEPDELEGTYQVPAAVNMTFIPFYGELENPTIKTEGYNVFKRCVKPFLIYKILLYEKIN